MKLKYRTVKKYNCIQIIIDFEDKLHIINLIHFPDSMFNINRKPITPNFLKAIINNEKTIRREVDSKFQFRPLQCTRNLEYEEFIKHCIP